MIFNFFSVTNPWQLNCEKSILSQLVYFLKRCSFLLLSRFDVIITFICWSEEINIVLIAIKFMDWWYHTDKVIRSVLLLQRKKKEPFEVKIWDRRIFYILLLFFIASSAKSLNQILIHSTKHKSLLLKGILL